MIIISVPIGITEANVTEHLLSAWLGSNILTYDTQFISILFIKHMSK